MGRRPGGDPERSDGGRYGADYVGRRVDHDTAPNLVAVLREFLLWCQTEKVPCFIKHQGQSLNFSPETMVQMIQDLMGGVQVVSIPMNWDPKQIENPGSKFWTQVDAFVSEGCFVVLTQEGDFPNQSLETNNALIQILREDGNDWLGHVCIAAPQSGQELDLYSAIKGAGLHIIRV